MLKASRDSSAFAWITFIGIILLLLGIYASARTVINLVIFPKYPQNGVISFNILSPYPYYPREIDCNYPPYEPPIDAMSSVNPGHIETPVEESQVSSSAPAKVIVSPPTPDKNQQEFQEKQQKMCLENVAESRSTTKINDMSQSILLLFLGAGILYSRKSFFA